MGEHQPNNAQVAWLASYSPSSTSYTNPRSALKTAGLIEYPSPDRLSITSDGNAAARPFTLTSSLLDFVIGNLPGPEARKASLARPAAEAVTARMITMIAAWSVDRNGRSIQDLVSLCL
jgi:hypothetical protein